MSFPRSHIALTFFDLISDRKVASSLPFPVKVEGSFSIPKIIFSSSISIISRASDTSQLSGQYSFLVYPYARM